MSEELLVLRPHRSKVMMGFWLCVFNMCLFLFMMIAIGSAAPTALFLVVPIIGGLFLLMAYAAYGALKTANMKTPLYVLRDDGIVHYGITGPSLGLIPWEAISSSGLIQNRRSNSTILTLKIDDFEKRVRGAECSELMKSMVLKSAWINRLCGGGHVNISCNLMDCPVEQIKEIVGDQLSSASSTL